MAYLTENQIEEMAHEAYETYFVSADKRAAIRRAKEHCIDQFGITPRKSAVLHAYNLAMTQWEEDKISSTLN